MNVLELPTAGSREVEKTKARRIEEEAKQRATAGCPYAYYFGQITFHYARGVLKLRGKLPTFHLKQVLQSRLTGLDGVERIDNQVEVVNATGLSYVRPR